MLHSNRRSIRLPGYDYSLAGAYFVTICTADKACLFGNIRNGEMVLNALGKVVDMCWKEIPKHFPNVSLHEYVIMPNHIHGIIEITVGANNYLPRDNDENITQMRRKMITEIRAKDVSPLRGTSRTVGSIIRGFKIGVTKWARQNTEIHHVWQRNYHEHIIRNGEDYQRIAQYIHDNPVNWAQDDLFR